MAASWTALDADPVTGDEVPDAFAELEARTTELRACFIGSAEPADVVDGMLWIDDSAIPWALKVRTKIAAGASTWQVVGPITRLSDSINADPSTADDRTAPFQHKALRVENVAALPGAVAGNAGMLMYRTTDGELYLADQPVAGAWKGLLSVKPGTSFDTLELPLVGDVGNDAVNPPTQVRKGVLEGWLFDATNEKRTFAFVMPKNWDGASDPQLRVYQVLDAAETAGDDIEWEGEIRTLATAVAKVTKAATALATASVDIGADADGIDDGGGPHRVVVVLDHDDATNPISVGCLCLVTLWRKTVGGAGKVAGTVVFRADLCYAQTTRHERA